MAPAPDDAALGTRSSVPPVPTDRPPTDLTLAGPWKATVADEGLRRSYPEVDFADDDWLEVSVPHHWRSEPAFAGSNGPLLYRTRFPTPAPFGPGADRADEADEPRRTWVVLDGVFYTSDVWLDGSYLGDTEGYFFPQSFEITDALAAHPDHLLALEVSCRPEAERTAKRNLTGVFQHWDLLDQDWNPGGIWRPVRLEQTGPVRIRHFRALCREANPETATVFVRAVLDTVGVRTVTIDTWLTPWEGAGGGGASARPDPALVQRRTHTLATGENRLEWTYDVVEPRLWWPHALGDQPLYELHVEVSLGSAGEPDTAASHRPLVSDARVRRIGLRSVTMKDWTFTVNGERLFLKGSNQGPTRMALAEAGPEDFTRDIQLAKDANLDFLRIHAHVSRPELYDAADEAGLLLWQDMPLQWGYHRSIRQEARREARELVDLLAHHPSIFVWCGHNEPMAIDVQPTTITDPSARNKLLRRAFIGQFLPAWNKSVLDHSIKRVIEKTDGSRPVVPHSGVFPHPPMFDGTDTHVYFGWYHGDERDFERMTRWWPRLARFVSEFGAQAVPEDASFLEPDRWPDLDWDRAHQTHALQKVFMDAHAPAADYATFDDWRAATQRYQAEVLRSHVEVLRRIKFRPCGGFAQFNFADGYPSVTWSVLGHDRQPKQGYHALARACAPVIVVADRLPAVCVAGEALSLDIHVVSDARIALSDMVVRAHLSWGEATVEPGPGTPVAGPLVRPVDPGSEWRWHGAIPPDSCQLVGTIDTVVPDGDGTLVLDLSVAPAPGADAPLGSIAFPVRNRYTAALGRPRTR